jgi:hypothetical protein
MSVLLLLVLIAATVWTGAFGGESVEDLHEIIGWTLLAIVALHVAAVIVMSVLQRENLARAMVTGDKPAARHLGAVDSRPPATLRVTSNIDGTSTKTERLNLWDGIALARSCFPTLLGRARWLWQGWGILRQAYKCPPNSRLTAWRCRCDTPAIIPVPNRDPA